jgi:hypothetical protein
MSGDRRSESDSHQRAIVAAFERGGASVVDLSQLGFGVPDLLVGYKGVTELVEVKLGNGRMSHSQRAMRNTWAGREVKTVRSPQYARKILSDIDHYVSRTSAALRGAPGHRTDAIAPVAVVVAPPLVAPTAESHVLAVRQEPSRRSWRDLFKLLRQA